MLTDRLKSMQGYLAAHDGPQGLSWTQLRRLYAEIGAAVEEAAQLEARPVPLCDRLTGDHLADPAIVVFPVIPRDTGGRP